MEQEFKDKIINTIRKEHGIAIDEKDPMFAIITANTMVLEEQLKRLNNNFRQQLIEIEQVTKNYLENGKELLEKNLTIALHEAKKTLKETQPQNIKEEKSTLTNPIIILVIGFIFGYSLSLFIF